MSAERVIKFHCRTKLSRAGAAMWEKMFLWALSRAHRSPYRRPDATYCPNFNLNMPYYNGHGYPHLSAFDRTRSHRHFSARGCSICYGEFHCEAYKLEWRIHEHELTQARLSTSSSDRCSTESEWSTLEGAYILGCLPIG